MSAYEAEMPWKVVQHLLRGSDNNTQSLYIAVGPADLRQNIGAERRRQSRPGWEDHSFGTYFNTFPAGYWRRWTNVPRARLSITYEGYGEIRLMRSSGTGKTSLMEVAAARDSGPIHFEIDLADFASGGYCWFESSARRDALTVVDAQWEIQTSDLRRARATIVITTRDRPDYCCDILRSLSGLHSLDADFRVLVIDQGEQYDMETIWRAAACESQLPTRFIRQANLGGSGGFARGMLEVLQRDHADFVILMDDDIRVQAETVFRGLQFAQACVDPKIIGGQMLEMGSPCTLYRVGERITTRSFRWKSARGMRGSVTLGAAPMVCQPKLHRTFEVDYNAWWNAVIPMVIVRKIGLPWPFFLKWDDIEYSLRAKQHGFGTVTLPGTGVWHESPEKGVHGWQRYFNLRNQLITALLHQDPIKGHFSLVLLDNLRRDVGHAIRGRAVVLALGAVALRDVRRPVPSLVREADRKAQLAKRIEAGYAKRTTRARRASGRSLLFLVFREYLQLARDSTSLADAYRAAGPSVTDESSWARLFAESRSTHVPIMVRHKPTE